MIFADLHMHGRFSRATSTALSIPNMEKWARVKGLDLLGTGDFAHPKWFAELKETLAEDGSGILKTKTGFSFLLSTEIANIYVRNNRQRRVHNVILAPDFNAVEQITAALLKKGRVDYDGRPIFGFSCPELVEMVLGIDERIEIIPAHIWTPWYAMFGSKSGFDSVEECFEDQARHIHALETGLSSDPAMNWRLSSLDRYSLVSFSDSHSFWPWRIGRECTMFDCGVEELTYKKILDALRGKKVAGTVEVDPSYGKYHWDGHRDCGISLEPKEAQKHKNICPVCRRPLTIGVLQRVEQLADRPEGYKPEGAAPFHSLIPLSEIIAAVRSGEPSAKPVWAIYNKLVEMFGSELNVLLNAGKDDLSKTVDGDIADAVIAVREGKVKMQPGYDGVYGCPVFGNENRPKKTEIKETPQKGIYSWLGKKQEPDG